MFTKLPKNMTKFFNVLTINLRTCSISVMVVKSQFNKTIFRAWKVMEKCQLWKSDVLWL